jgi:hypothetical protein
MIAGLIVLGVVCLGVVALLWSACRLGADVDRRVNPWGE